MKRFIIIIVLVLGFNIYLMSQFPYALSGPDDKGHIIYPILLIALIASRGLFRSQGKMGETIRHSLTWLIIILALVIGYSFKDALLGNLLPHRAMIQEDGTMVFRAEQDGHFYIEVSINQVPVRMMVDTGASDITLSPGDAARLGFSPQEQDFTRNYSTANGAVKGAPVMLDTVAIGSIMLTHMPASIDHGMMETSLLGMSFFKQLHGFSVQGDRLTLKP